ncbi:MAG: flagellar basal body P-ring formation chaperone FlgA [Planctomycetota bacterium]|jgi:flagella basal body P-ring formation protein FlgA
MKTGLKKISIIKAVISAVLLFAVSADYSSAGITVNLKEKAVVDGAYIRVSDVAEVKDDNGKQSNLSTIFLGPAPVDNEVTVINRWHVRECLMANGVESAGLVISGNSVVKVFKSKKEPFSKYRLKVFKGNEKAEVQSCQKKPDIRKKDTDKKIYRKVTAFSARDIKKIALQKAQNHISALFSGINAKVKVELLYLERKAFNIASFSDLEIEHSPAQTRSSFQRITFAVYDAGKNRVNSFYGNFRLRILQKVILTEAFIPRGTILTKNMVKTGYAEISKGQNTCVSIEKVIGKKCRTDIKEGSPIYTRVLVIPEVVKRNQPVQVTARRGSFVIQQFGTAMSSGGIGQIVNVKNNRSGKVFPAKIMENGQLELLMAGNK